jgi:hypothetical protein
LLHFDRNAGDPTSASGTASRPGQAPSGQPVYTGLGPVDVRRALPIDVRRALPAVPRALPVSSGVSNTVASAAWQPIRMPDGTVLNVSYQGELPSSAALPPRGRFIGEEYRTGTVNWVWMTPAGSTFPAWIDP